MLWMFQRVYYGPITHDENASLSDLAPREWSAIVPLAAAALVMGIFPGVFLRPTEPAVGKIVEKVQTSQSLRVEKPGRPQEPGLRDQGRLRLLVPGP
jgi:NADH-quinone oxidoreductase subunit M